MQALEGRYQIILRPNLESLNRTRMELNAVRDIKLFSVASGLSDGLFIDIDPVNLHLPKVLGEIYTRPTVTVADDR